MPAALALGMSRRVAAVLLAVLVVIALVVELARARSMVVSRLFVRLFAPMLRAREARGITGATWLLATMCVGVALCPTPAAIAATWAAAAGDAAAGLVGMRFGRHRSPRDGKSLEGSAACCVATFIGAWALARLALPLAATCAIAAAVAERTPWPRDDNTRLVAVVGLVATLGLALR